jgi:hypothetical protein
MPFTNKEWMESFAIFDKYCEDPAEEGIHYTTGDDIYAGPDPEKVSDSDMKRLEELGWHDYDTGSFHTFS